MCVPGVDLWVILLRQFSIIEANISFAESFWIAVKEADSIRPRRGSARGSSLFPDSSCMTHHPEAIPGIPAVQTALSDECKLRRLVKPLNLTSHLSTLLNSSQF